jgi:hypothetical protein
LAKKKKEEFVSYTETELKEAALKRQAELAATLAKRKPLTPRQAKISNFWYHYKIHMIGGLIVLALLAIFVRDIVFRVEPDVNIELATSGYIGSDTIDTLQTALAAVLTDRNGDGRVVVSISPTQISAAVISPETAATAPADPIIANPMGGDAEADYANIMKFTAIIATYDDPLYLVDDGVYDFLMRMGTYDDGSVESMFTEHTGLPGAEGEKLPFAATSLADVPGLEYLDGLSFCIRENTKTDEKDLAYYQYCEELLGQLTMAN